MYNAFGISAPALCGTWIEPDADLAGSTEGDAMVRYVSCSRCDRQHERNARTQTQ